jgi:hypothetical protein
VRRWIAEQIAEDLERVALPLRGGAEHGGEHLLRVCAAPRAIAPRDFTVDDGWSECLLGAPGKCRPYCYAESRRLGLRWWS